jgi:stage II sporulation protein D
VKRPAATSLALLAALASPCAADPADDGLRALAAAAGETEPLFRIGLEAGPRIVVSSDRPFQVVDPATRAAVWRPSYEGELAIVADGGPETPASPVYRVQAASLPTPAAAETERARLAAKYDVEAVVRPDPDRGWWRVRLGRTTDRSTLLPLLARLRADGLTGAWVAEEPPVEEKGVRIRLVDRSWESFATDAPRIAVVPTGSGRIRVGGKAYRGVGEVRTTAYGTVRAIDWVEMENYLLGVVPAELGPEVYPRLEALKAQAVAARTYAWRHRGQFADEGYDLCATPRCQVYEGASAEHPMTDRAVATTRGEILAFGGEPITALYTATCGGHTENAKDVFPEEDAPYLAGVPCRAEAEALATVRTFLAGRRLGPIESESGEDVTRDAALLAAAGVLEGPPEKGALGHALDPRTLRRWTSALLRLAGRPQPTGREGATATLGEASVSLVADLGWDERARVLLGEGDAQALVRDAKAASLPAERRAAIAYLAWQGGLQPFPDGSFHAGDRPSRARLVPAIVRAGDAYDAFALQEATFLGGAGPRVRLARGKGELELPVAKSPFLFAFAGGRAAPAAELELRSGDRVRYRVGASGEIDFLEMRPPVRGAADDRMSTNYAWEVRKTRQELEASLDKKLGIGTLQDLAVVRRGVYGRVAELRVVGSDGTAVARGFDVRTLLGLKESLTVIEPQRDSSGKIVAVVFAGKGWGHGVGLCQVGAYGMALRGADYKKILAHYYRGTTIATVP